MPKIKYLKARQILDSRGSPTVEVDMSIDDGEIFRASVPSGASTGKYEAVELRDNNDNYNGKSVHNAVSNVNDLIKNDQIIFKYCDKSGNVNDRFNPNGSLLNIAGICNLERNVFGMMPHPERAADTDLSNEDGKFLFDSLIKNFKN